MKTYSPQKIFYGSLIGILILLALYIQSFLNLHHNTLGSWDYFYTKTGLNEATNLPPLFPNIPYLLNLILFPVVGIGKRSGSKDRRFWLPHSFPPRVPYLDELLRIPEKVGKARYAPFEHIGKFLFSRGDSLWNPCEHSVDDFYPTSLAAAKTNPTSSHKLRDSDSNPGGMDRYDYRMTCKFQRPGSIAAAPHSGYIYPFTHGRTRKDTWKGFHVFSILHFLKKYKFRN